MASCPLTRNCPKTRSTKHRRDPEGDPALVQARQQVAPHASPPSRRVRLLALRFRLAPHEIRCLIPMPPPLAPAAAAPTNCGRFVSRGASPSTPRARCWSHSATRACSAPRASLEKVPRLHEGQGHRLGDRRIRHAAALDAYAQRPRGGPRQAGRPDAGDPAADRPQPARGDRHAGCWASAPSTSTATCCRPTAAPAPRRSPAPGWRCATRSTACCERGAIARLRCAARWPPSRSGSSADGQVLLDLDYGEDSTCDTDMNVVMTDAQGAGGGAGHRRRRAVLPGPGRSLLDGRAGTQGHRAALVAAAEAGASAAVMNRGNRWVLASAAIRASRASSRPCSRRWASRSSCRRSSASAMRRSRIRPSSRTRWPRRGMLRALGPAGAGRRLRHLRAGARRRARRALGALFAGATAAARQVDLANNRKLICRRRRWRSRWRRYYYCVVVLMRHRKTRGR